MNGNILTVGQSVDEVIFNEELRQLGLFGMWEHIQKTNPSANLPYHNTKHMQGVAILAWKIYNAMPNYQDPGNLGRYQELKALLIACLWHDYDHSGGKEVDSVNINRAIAGFDKWNTSARRDRGIGTQIIEKAKQIIQVTEFPFVHYPDFHLEKIIRDADLLYTFSDNTGMIVFGLFSEMLQAGKFPEGFTFDDFLKGQRNFLSNAQFFTNIGDEIAKTHTERVLGLQIQYGETLSDALELAKVLKWDMWSGWKNDK